MRKLQTKPLSRIRRIEGRMTKITDRAKENTQSKQQKENIEKNAECGTAIKDLTPGPAESQKKRKRTGLKKYLKK